MGIRKLSTYFFNLFLISFLCVNTAWAGGGYSKPYKSDVYRANVDKANTFIKDIDNGAVLNCTVTDKKKNSGINYENYWMMLSAGNSVFTSFGMATYYSIPFELCGYDDLKPFRFYGYTVKFMSHLYTDTPADKDFLIGVMVELKPGKGPYAKYSALFEANLLDDGRWEITGDDGRVKGHATCIKTAGPDLPKDLWHWE